MSKLPHEISIRSNALGPESDGSSVEVLLIVCKHRI
jgi:hypothetical protein